MRLEKLEKNSPDIISVKKLNEQAFPENERVSIEGLIDFGSDGSMDILGQHRTKTAWKLCTSSASVSPNLRFG